MADRIVSETAGIRRLRTVKGQRWRDDARGDEAAEKKRQGSGSRTPAKARRKSRSGGGIDEFA